MSAPVGRAEEPTTPRSLRWLWFCCGWVAIVVGSIGIVIPGLPTTVFFIVAAWCFARSSPRFERWLLNLPHVGQLVQDHRAGLGMPQRAKVLAISMIVAFSSVSAFLTRDRWPLSVAIVILAVVGVGYIAWRVPTRERVLAARSVPPV